MLSNNIVELLFSGEKQLLKSSYGCSRTNLNVLHKG